MTLANLKYALRIDNSYNDINLTNLINSANASLKATIGYKAGVSKETEFDTIVDTYIVEYVRGIYFHIDNERILTVLQGQLQSLIEETSEVIFELTPIDAVIVLKKNDVTISETTTSVYNLVSGKYTYSITADGYESVTDEELIIKLSDLHQTKNIVIELAEV